ncbi:related to MFS transporter [Phialocephala subalpina]|uniref:Related to MFS transporter n=1 Tax=Phialocephala subalpina TaxID=576137 RepID=A0A1L7WHG4_9HELO|nr:related to MFS transporter [Phialocephala subalpina]
MDETKKLNLAGEETMDIDVVAATPSASSIVGAGIELTVPGELVVTEELGVKKRSKVRLIAIVVALNLVLFISALDQTIVATAIPTIVSDLGTASGYVWIGGAYIIANAASSPIWTKLSDIWGRKPIILTSSAMFFGSSILAAESRSMKMLIIARSFQGLSSGGLVTQVYIVISDMFSMRERSLPMGLTALVFTVAGAAGPIMGGVFAQTIGWIFWINLPISGSAFFMILGFLDVHNPKTKMRDGIKAIDWAGGLCILGLILMLLLGLDFGGATFPWSSPQVICLVLFGSLMSIFFVFSEKRLAKYPLMPLEIFRESSNVAVLVLVFFHGMISLAIEYYPPLYFQAALGASPLHSGVLSLPLVVTESLMSIFSGVFIHRTGHYLELIRIGPVIMTIGVGMYILFSATSSTGEVVGLQILTGIGCGLLFGPPLLALQAFVPQQNVATASSTYGFIRSIGTAMSVVIGGVIFQNTMDSRVDTLSTPPLNLPSNITDLLSKGQAAANVIAVNLIQDQAQKMAVQKAYAGSLRNSWIFYTVASGCCIVATLFIKKKVLSKDHVETKTGIDVPIPQTNPVQVGSC